MQTCDLRIDAAWVVPIEPAGALAAHAVLIDAGRIVAVEPRASANERFEPRSHLELPHHVLLPGLVNAHTHAAMNLFRGIADDLELDVWLEQHIWPREARFVDEGFVYDGARLAAAEMLRGGVTCCNDMYFFPEASARAFLELGLRAMLGVAILDFPTAYAADANGYLARGPRRPRRAEARAHAVVLARASCARTRSATRRGRRSSCSPGSSTCPSRRISPKPRAR
jgi:5-methylthioadenosine/S-adenosylhomocysteine deaminase